MAEFLLRLWKIIGKLTQIKYFTLWFYQVNIQEE